MHIKDLPIKITKHDYDVIMKITSQGKERFIVYNNGNIIPDTNLFLAFKDNIKLIEKELDQYNLYFNDKILPISLDLNAEHIFSINFINYSVEIDSADLALKLVFEEHSKNKQYRAALSIKKFHSKENIALHKRKEKMEYENFVSNLFEKTLDQIYSNCKIKDIKIVESDSNPFSDLLFLCYKRVSEVGVKRYSNEHLNNLPEGFDYSLIVEDAEYYYLYDRFKFKKVDDEETILFIEVID